MDGNTILEYFKEIGVNTRNWIEYSQVRDYSTAFLNVVLNLRDPKAWI